MGKLSDQLKKANQTAYDEIIAMVEVETDNFIQENFNEEGFDGSKWASVKSKKSSKILTKTGELADTLEFEVIDGKVRVTSPTPYAKVHNEGGKAGIGGRSTITKRQFIGESETLKATFDKEITEILNKTLGR